ncbi:MAG: helix-turn-helix domain-containing protein [Atopobium sp.]|jgi:excisionase family DNA binding protein|nr:helix-turn-helix domain-containing protein [Atopobium sp.]
MIERTYTVTEVAKMTGFARTTVYDAVKCGDIKALLPNGVVRGFRIRESEVERWMKSMEQSDSR